MAKDHQAYLRSLEQDYERPLLVRNLMPRSPSAGLTVTIGLAAGQGNPVNAGPINFTATFSKPATGFTNADISFAGSTVGGTLAAAVTGTGPYNVAVTGMTGNGIVTVSIPAGSATDAIGTPFPASGTASVMLDTAQPTVTINIDVGQADPTTISPINYKVVFSKPVTGFTSPPDISFTGSTVGGTLSATITGSGANYNVAVTGMAAPAGNVVASIPAAAATDAVGNTSLASTSTDNTVAFNIGADPGWTTFTTTMPSGEGSAFLGAGTRVVYVSQSTGNDSNPGTLASPVKTLAAGSALIRSGKPDWLLLKKGDTWTNERFGFVGFNGISSTQPILLSSYGTGARPLLKTTPNVDTAPVIGSLNVGNLNNVAIVGIELYCYTRNPADPGYNASTKDIEHTAIYLVASSGTSFNYLLIEDCKIRFYALGISIVWSAFNSNANVFIRRNVITDSYSDTGHSQGCYLQSVGHPTFFQNVWDANGADIFSRNVYIEQSCGPASVDQEISTNSGSEGLQLRTGGTMTNSLFVLNAIGFDVGHQLDADGAPTIHSATVTNNVVMQSKDIGANPRAHGIQILNATGSGIQVTNNIVSQMTPGTGGGDGTGIILDGNTASCVCTGNIIYKWDNGILNNGTGNTVSPNDVDLAGTNNNPGGAAPREPFVAPTRTLGSYYGSIGGSPTTAAGFITAARLQSKDNWNPALIADAVNTYIRAGFASI